MAKFAWRMEIHHEGDTKASLVFSSLYRLTPDCYVLTPRSRGEFEWFIPIALLSNAQPVAGRPFVNCERVVAQCLLPAIYPIAAWRIFAGALTISYMSGNADHLG